MKLPIDDAKILAAIDRLSEQQSAEIVAIDRLSAATVKLAQACESLERDITDRMDVIEGRLDELKPKEQQSAEIVAGHRRWTQRRDSRWNTHFNMDELKSNIAKAGSDGN